MEISEILTISFYPHILKLKGTYELINYLNFQKHFMVFFRLELEEAKKHKSNQMEYDALARIINKNKDRKTTQGKSPTVHRGPRTRVLGDLWPGWMSKLFEIYFRWWLWKDQIDEVQGQTDALLKENQALDKKLSDRRRELHVLLQAMFIFMPRTIIIYSNMNRQRRTRSRIIGFG